MRYFGTAHKSGFGHVDTIGIDTTKMGQRRTLAATPHPAIDIPHTGYRIIFTVIQPHSRANGVTNPCRQTDLKIVLIVSPVAPQFGWCATAVNQQIHIAIVVIICKRHSGGRAGRVNIEIVPHEGKIAIIQKQRTPHCMAGGEKQIFITIVVNIGTSHAGITAVKSLPEAERPACVTTLLKHADGSRIGAHQIEVTITVEITKGDPPLLFVYDIVIDGSISGKTAALVDKEISFSIIVSRTRTAHIKIHIAVNIKIRNCQILTIHFPSMNICITVFTQHAVVVQIDSHTEVIVLYQQVKIAIRIMIDPRHSLRVARIKISNGNKTRRLSGCVSVEYQPVFISRGEIGHPIVVEITPHNGTGKNGVTDKGSDQRKITATATLPAVLLIEPHTLIGIEYCIQTPVTVEVRPGNTPPFLGSRRSQLTRHLRLKSSMTATGKGRGNNERQQNGVQQPFATTAQTAGCHSHSKLDSGQKPVTHNETPLLLVCSQAARMLHPRQVSTASRSIARGRGYHLLRRLPLE